MMTQNPFMENFYACTMIVDNTRSQNGDINVLTGAVYRPPSFQ